MARPFSACRRPPSTAALGLAAGLAGVCPALADMEPPEPVCPPFAALGPWQQERLLEVVDNFPARPEYPAVEFYEDFSAGLMKRNPPEEICAEDAVDLAYQLRWMCVEYGPAMASRAAWQKAFDWMGARLPWGTEGNTVKSVVRWLSWHSAVAAWDGDLEPPPVDAEAVAAALDALEQRWTHWGEAWSEYGFQDELDSMLKELVQPWHFVFDRCVRELQLRVYDFEEYDEDSFWDSAFALRCTPQAVPARFEKMLSRRDVVDLKCHRYWNRDIREQAPGFEEDERDAMGEALLEAVDAIDEGTVLFELSDLILSFLFP